MYIAYCKDVKEINVYNNLLAQREILNKTQFKGNIFTEMFLTYSYRPCIFRHSKLCTCFIDEIALIDFRLGNKYLMPIFIILYFFVY